MLAPSPQANAPTEGDDSRSLVELLDEAKEQLWDTTETFGLILGAVRDIDDSETE